MHKACPYDVEAPLTAFFKAKSMSNMEEDIKLLCEVRKNATAATEPTEQSWQALLRYNVHLSSLAARFASYESEAKFDFAWMDPYRLQQKIISSSIYFEWGCVKNTLLKHVKYNEW